MAALHSRQPCRRPVTCVAFIPMFSSLGPGSEDATIKIRDWELGDLEKTVKVHIKATQDLDFGD